MTARDNIGGHAAEFPIGELAGALIDAEGPATEPAQLRREVFADDPGAFELLIQAQAAALKRVNAAVPSSYEGGDAADYIEHLHELVVTLEGEGELDKDRRLGVLLAHTLEHTPPPKIFPVNTAEGGPLVPVAVAHDAPTAPLPLSGRGSVGAGETTDRAPADVGHDICEGLWGPEGS
jgi:hypothetical protein